MTLEEALDLFNKSPLAGKEEIEKYVPCKDGMVFITKSQDDFDDEDDFLIGDSICLLVRPNGKVELTTPADVDYNSDDIKFIK